ncbi:MAG: recombinase family protein, partial [Nitrospinota bacterium]|nr:recombinase family protein [Nitrospinota bacterium]
MKAVIYARSSKERHDVSIPSQVDELKALAKRNGDTIVQVFKDKAESAKTDERPAFQEMMALAKGKGRPFDRIYCYDTSRFSRRREHATAYKGLLKKAGIDLIFLKLPKSDTYVDTIIEGVFEVFDEFHSQKSKADGLRGMRQNAKQGYRAGGSAPYGYRLVPAYTGTNAEGSQVIKNKLEPDPETAPFAREYFERRAGGESREAILRDFSRRGIRPPRGNGWSGTTGFSLERNLDVYLGRAVWNRHSERIDGEYVGGSKYRDPSEWVVIEGAHEPLVTPDTAEKVQALWKKDGRGWHGRRESRYILSGILHCALCGERFHGGSGLY